MISSQRLLAAALTASIAVVGCGGSDSSTADTTPPPVEDATAAGIRVVSATDAAATIADPPADLVILDVRTQEEFDEAHIQGAVMLDFSRDDFAAQLAEFDPDVPYVLYCRSGNRSSGARAIMSELGFRSVEDIDGGIVGWQQAGFPVATG